MGEKGYVFDQAHEAERERLSAIEDYLDARSRRWLEDRGLRQGWRCLDVGAGGGSLAAWLARQVAPSGSVVACDLDTRFLEELDEPNLELRQQDVLADDFPRNEFDLVHSRYLLEHLAEREVALRQLVRAARPGGWVVVTDAGGQLPEPLEPCEALDRCAAAFTELVSPAGWDLGFAPRLPELMRAQGLSEVGGEGFRTFEIGGGGGSTRVMWDTYGRLRDALPTTGRVSAEEVDQARAALQDEKRSFRSFETWTAWGRLR